MRCKKKNKFSQLSTSLKYIREDVEFEPKQYHTTSGIDQLLNTLLKMEKKGEFILSKEEE